MVRGQPRATSSAGTDRSYLDCRTYDLDPQLLDLTQQNTVELNLGDPERLAGMGKNKEAS